MKKNKLVLISVLAVLSITAVFSLNLNIPSISEGIKYNSQVCIYKNNVLVHCSPNLITDAGKNHIKNYLGLYSATGSRMDYLAISNTSTAIATGDTALGGEMGTECALGRAQGTYYSFNTGAWNISYQWTNSCNSGIVVNTTALLNASSSGTLLAENTFTSVTLIQNDKLNTTWGIWIT